MHRDFPVIYWLILWAAVHDTDFYNPLKHGTNFVMNEDKIDKYFSKCLDLDKDLPRRKLTPIILTDSKAHYLYQESGSRLEHGIVWLYEPGLRAGFGKFELFVFLGTCDRGLKTVKDLY